jgi:phage anti-repressor protein
MSIDIVNLIEINPITKLTGNYNSKLIEKVKNNFNNYEQQMFIASFYCYLNYDYKNDFVIDLDNVWKWLGFSQKYHAKYLLEKQFNKNIDFKIFATEGSVAKNEKRGGHNKEIIMLNVDTFKKICLKAGTKKADEIHDYFIKLEQILQEVLIEESSELKKQLEQKDLELSDFETQLSFQKILEREKILLNQYASIGSIVYIIKVKTYENSCYVIKIGESRKGILDRYKEHKSKYEECLLLDCFSVNKSKDFESFLHNHIQIRNNKVYDLLNHEKELELFLIGKNLTYQSLLNIIRTNISSYQFNINELISENQQLKFQIENTTFNCIPNPNNNLLEQLINTVQQLSIKIDYLEKSNKELIEKVNPVTPRLVTGFEKPLGTLGPRVQKINPETLQLIKVYDSIAEVLKENPSLKRPSIQKAVSDNTVYHHFRWYLVDRELDPTILPSLCPTKQTKIQNLGFIAKLNKEKTEILNVYLDRKTAALSNGYESNSALDNPVKNSSISKGYLYKVYHECEENVRLEFEEKIKASPLLYKNGVGQFDLQNNLVKEFSCKYDCIKQLKISDKTLAKALDKNISYNGFYYKCLEPKLKIY